MDYSNKSKQSSPELEVNDLTLLYDYKTRPQWYLSIIYGLQFFLTVCIPNAVGTLLVVKAMCIHESDPLISELISISFLVMGVNTLLQTFCGARLTILQGATYILLIPIISYTNEHGGGNSCNRTALNMIPKDQIVNQRDSSVLSTLTRINTALMIASVVEIILAITGLVGFLMKLIAPVTIAAIFTVLSFSIGETMVNLMGTNWPISITTTAAMIITILLLPNVEIPIWLFSCKQKCFKTKINIFKTCPVIVVTIVMCIICGILTVIPGLIPNDPDHWAYSIRIDSKTFLITSSKAAIYPIPFKYGYPKISGQLITSIISCIIISTVESIGDYIVTAKTIGAPSPPRFAINRGILIEGFGVFISGLFGLVAAPTSYSNNIGLIRITKVGHRIIAQVAAGIMVICGFFPIISSVIACIPDPVIGGSSIIILCMIFGESLNYLSVVNLKSNRNIFTFCLSVILGWFIPLWFKNNESKIKTGFPTLDDMITALLSVNMFITAFLSIFFDVILPGNRMKLEDAYKSNKNLSDPEDEDREQERQDYYDIYPLRVLAIKFKCFQYIPIFPKINPTNNGVRNDVYEEESTNI